MMAVLPDESKAIRDYRLQKIKHIAISVFMLFYIVAITCWCIPLESPRIDNLRCLIHP